MDQEKIDNLASRLLAMEQKHLELENRLHLLEQGDHLVVSPKLEEINNPAEIILTEPGENLPLAPNPTKPNAVETAEPTAVIEHPEAPSSKKTIIITIVAVILVTIAAITVLLIS